MGPRRVEEVDTVLSASRAVVSLLDDIEERRWLSAADPVHGQVSDLPPRVCPGRNLQPLNQAYIALLPKKEEVVSAHLSPGVCP